ncbi:hypothetical protein EN812_31150 [Mesorhizobium sp. M4B.F.Ca.ET.169.01.1.1]|nr:hypothetical protein EN812_31150 [Mesorhizobium sp. M4B.F.Ca.ET.169.01.1.1]
MAKFKLETQAALDRLTQQRTPRPRSGEPSDFDSLSGSSVIVHSSPTLRRCRLCGLHGLLIAAGVDFAPRVFVHLPILINRLTVGRACL